MNYRTYQISDAVRLSHIRTDRFKSARLSVTLTAPTDRSLSPINSMLIPAAFRGTAKYRSFKDFCIRSEDLYAATLSDMSGRSGDCQTVGVRAQLLNDEYVSVADRAGGLSLLDGTVEMMSEIFFAPLYREKDVENDKTNRINYIRSRKNYAYAFAKHRFASIMFDGDPYGMSLSGEEELIRGLTPELFQKRRRELIASAPVDVFYCGSAEVGSVIQVLERHLVPGFSGKHPVCGSPVPVNIVRRAKDPRTVEEEGLYNQSYLLLGFRTDSVLDDETYYATELMNVIFGDGSRSKLFLNVREKLSLCYFCASSYDCVKGVITVGCGIDRENYGNARDEIMRQLDEIRRGNISDDELTCAKRSIEDDCRSAEDHPEDYELFGIEARAFGGPRSIEEYRQKIMEVSRDGIVDAARRLTLDTSYFLAGTLKGGDLDLDE